MSSYKRKEIMDYLTRKPVTSEDIQLARTRIQTPVTPLPMQVTSGEGLPNPPAQVELAAGGRAEFKNAGLASNEPVKAGELLSYLKKYDIDIHPGNLSRSTQMYGIKSPSSGKYILPSKDEIKIIKEEWYKNQQRAPATTEIGRKTFDERSKLVKELVASEKYNPSEIKDIIQKKYNVDMGNTIQKEINQQRKEGKIIPSAREGETSTNAKKLLNDLNLLDKNKKIKDILSNPEFDLKKDYPGIFKEAKNTLSLDDSKTNYRLASLLKSYSEEKLPANKNIINNSNEIYSSYLKDRPFGSLGSVLYRKQQVEPGVASQINEDPNFFSNTRKKISRLLPGENIYSTDELKNLISSYENKTGPYSLFVQGIKKDINLGKGRTIDKVINQTEKELQKLDPKDIDYLDKRETIKDKYNERVKEFTNKYNKDLKKGELPVRGLELSFDSPKDSLVRYNELKKINPDLIEGVEDIYSKYNYSFKVPADVKTIPEALGFVKSPEGQQLMQKAANVNAARVYTDSTGIGNFLETNLGQTLSKSAPNLLKTTVRLSTITGAPINALLGVALYSDEFKEKGLGDLETIAAGAYKGSTQDFLNFGDLITRKLGVATYEKFTENKPFLENWLGKPEYFEFADKQIDKYASEKSIKDRIRNRAEYEVRKSFPPTISETEVPVTATTEEYENLIKVKENEILNLNPDLKKLYEQENIIKKEIKPAAPKKPLFLGSLVITPNYTQEEKKVVYNQKENNTEEPKDDLYIPPLAKEDSSIREGVLNLAFGGRVNFSGGGIKLARLISDVLLDLKNSIHIVGNTARFQGIQKAKLEALTPYRNIPDQSKHTTILESINKARQNLPKEYHSILDDIKKDVDNFDYATADNRIMALDKTVAPELRFESLSKDLFPMEDPLNKSFIIMDPNRDNMTSRYVMRIGMDPETGRGIRQTFDTFDSESRKFLNEKDWKLIGVESLEKGKEGLN